MVPSQDWQDSRSKVGKVPCSMQNSRGSSVQAFRVHAHDWKRNRSQVQPVLHQQDPQGCVCVCTRFWPETVTQGARHQDSVLTVGHVAHAKDDMSKNLEDWQDCALSYGYMMLFVAVWPLTLARKMAATKNKLFVIHVSLPLGIIASCKQIMSQIYCRPYACMVLQQSQRDSQRCGAV